MKKFMKFALVASVVAAGVGFINKVVCKKKYAQLKKCCCSEEE